MMTHPPYTIALIGGIASGKSSILNFFEKLGIKTISADVIAKEILKKKQPAYVAIVNHLGPSILLDNQELNRAHLREKLISEPSFKKWLENLTHPIIQKKILESIQQAKSVYCVVEIPLLQNRTDYPIDRVLWVNTPEDKQRIYLKARGLKPYEIEGLLKIQIEKNQQKSLADDIIENVASLQKLEQEVQALHTKYIELISTNINGLDG